MNQSSIERQSGADVRPVTDSRPLKAKRPLLGWFRSLFQEEPHYCPICGRRMIRGYSNPRAIVDDMCPCPHPILNIPRIEVP